MVKLRNLKTGQVNTLSNSEGLVRPVVSPDGRFLLPALGIGPATFMLVVAARMNLNWFVRRKLGTGKARQIPFVGRRDSKK